MLIFHAIYMLILHAIYMLILHAHACIIHTYIILCYSIYSIVYLLL